MKKRISLKQVEWILFIIVMVIMFFSTQTYFETANYSRIYKIDAICILIFLGISICTNHGILRIKRENILPFNLILIPCIYQIAVSVLFYFMNRKIELSNLINSNVQALLICMLAIVAYISFGKKALKGVLIASVINYLFYIIICIIKFGPLSLFQAGTDTGASRLLEVHEITFVFGLFIIYFITTDYFKNKRINKKWIWLVAIFCLLGFKRILILGIVLAILAYYLLKKIRKPSLIITVSLAVVAISLLWVYICSSWDILTGISNKFGIELSGRNWIYSNFYPYYDFSVSYTGAGIGYVQQLINSMSAMAWAGHKIGLHNEYMRLFIELGFIPYLIYFIGVWPLAIRILYKKAGYKSALVYFLLWMVTAICLATDNLLTYPNFMLAFGLMIITSVKNTREPCKPEYNS